MIDRQRISCLQYHISPDFLNDPEDTLVKNNGKTRLSYIIPEKQSQISTKQASSHFTNIFNIFL